MRKLGYRFSAVPRDRHPEWFEVPLLTRALGHELYAASCADTGESRPIPVAGDWRVSLCKMLCIESNERGAARAAFTTMERHGLVRVSPGLVTVVWLATERVAGVQDGGQRGGSEGAAGGQRGGSVGLTVENDSGQLAREEEIRGEEIERARPLAKVEPPSRVEQPPLPEPSEQSAAEPADVDSGSRARQEYVLQLQKVGLEFSRITTRDDAQAFRAIGEFADAQSAAMGITSLNVIHAVFDGFFSDPKMAEHGWPPKFANDRKLKYFQQHPAAARSLRVAR